MSSPKVVVANSTLTGPAKDGIIGICVDHSLGASVVHNEVSGYAVGLCVESDGVDANANRVHDNTIGIWVDPGFKDVRVRKNIVKNNTRPDALFIDQLGLHNAGVFVDGAKNTVVEGNTITGTLLYVPIHNSKFADLITDGIIYTKARNYARWLDFESLILAPLDFNVLAKSIWEGVPADVGIEIFSSTNQTAPTSKGDTFTALWPTDRRM